MLNYENVIAELFGISPPGMFRQLELETAFAESMLNYGVTATAIIARWNSNPNAQAAAHAPPPGEWQTVR